MLLYFRSPLLSFITKDIHVVKYTHIIASPSYEIRHINVFVSRMIRILSSAKANTIDRITGLYQQSIPKQRSCLTLIHVALLLFHSHGSRCSSSWKLIHWSNLLPKVASSMPALHILVLEYTRLHLIRMRFLKLYSYIPICVHQIRPLDAALGTS